MLFSPAYAQAAGGAPGGFDFISLMPLVLIFVVFYFLLIRPQQKKMKTHRDMIGAVKRGDRVLTGGGILGTVVKVEDSDDILLVEIAKDIRVRVARGTISTRSSRSGSIRWSTTPGGFCARRGSPIAASGCAATP